MALPLALILFGAFAAQTVVGFGSAIITLTLASFVYPVTALVPLLVLLGTLQSAYIAARHSRHVEWRLLLTRILPLMGVGLAIGFLGFDSAPEVALKRALGAIVVVLSALELCRVFSGIGEDGPRNPLAATAALLGAGVMHGLLAIGGPLLVYAVSRIPMTPAAFRSTLAYVWLALNAVLIGAYITTGRLDAALGMEVALAVPVVIAAVVIGERIHHRIDAQRFRQGVFGLLLVAGAALLLSG